MAADRCELLMGQFRRDDADNPEVFTTALIALLAEYPPVVLDHICSPLDGLASSSRFVPSLFEIREACNKHLAYLYAKWQVERMPPEVRARIESYGKEKPRELPAPERPRMTREQMVAKYGENFGLSVGGERKSKPDSFKMPTLGELTEHYRSHDLAFRKKPVSYQKEKDYGCEEKEDERSVQREPVSQGAGGDEQD